MKTFTFLLALAATAASISAREATAVASLLERIAPGSAERFELVVDTTPADSSAAARYFEIAPGADGRVRIAGNDNNSVAMGLHHYLKHFTGNHLSWDNMTATLPDTLPLPAGPERYDNPLPLTYYLNYCTHSYSMAFWDWERWEREIDWMALHGVNLPLALTGTDAAWRNTLLRLGYSADEANAFVAGPAFQAWWLMNNLEGWGGPNSDAWYDRQTRLQRSIIARMRELDIHPVLPGYSGMVPHDARRRLGLDVADPGLWCAFNRPAFLQPGDSRFAEVADIYYDELTRLYGQADFYAMDPFHEGGNTDGVDLTAAARNITAAMKRCSPEAVWVVQGWQGNPLRELLAGVDSADMLVLDLWAESDPRWGDPEGPERFRDGRPGGHGWLYCMLLNFGGNVGLHGKMQSIPPALARARKSPTLRGVGLTMEGIGNNPVMYEMMSELPWLPADTQWQPWLDTYIRARYGAGAAADGALTRAWRMLARSIYNCPPESRQQGTSESIFCARPGLGVTGASSWVNDSRYYDRDSVIAAVAIFDSACRAMAPELRNSRLDYDRIDLLRQSLAEQGHKAYDRMCEAVEAGNRDAFRRHSREFMALLWRQDSLLAAHPDFRLDTWLDGASAAGSTPGESRDLRRTALVQITTWGGREASERGGLHDYANKEWNGLLSGFYAPRWQRWIDSVDRAMADGRESEPIDWFEFESALVDRMLAE